MACFFVGGRFLGGGVGGIFWGILRGGGLDLGSGVGGNRRGNRWKIRRKKSAILRLYRGAQSAGSDATKAGVTSSEKVGGKFAEKRGKSGGAIGNSADFRHSHKQKRSVYRSPPATAHTPEKICGVACKVVSRI